MQIVVIFIAFMLFLFRNYVFFYLKNIKKIIKYGISDTYKYFKNKEYKNWNGFGLRFYCGLFGTGKTLSATKYVISQAKRFDLNIISNIKLYGIKYTPLVNYKQIIDAEPNTIILIDEISTLWNSRDYRNFPVDLLFQLLQNRKNHIQLVATAQRFAHVDKLLRDIAYSVTECSKFWRFTFNRTYDAFKYENVSFEFLQPIYFDMCFISNTDYESYDTDEVINNAKKSEFISNDEILNRRIETVYNPLKIGQKGFNRQFKKRLKNKK